MCKTYKGVKKLIKVKQFVQERYPFYRAFDYALYKLGLITHKSYTTNWDNYYYRKLLKKYNKELTETLQELPQEKGNKVWFCWLQGIENAPDVVKLCYSQARRILKNKKELVLITKDNFNEYARLPEWIIEKWNAGEISNTHFSDLLRLELLIANGGLWLDSTAYLTEDIPDTIERSSFFVFRDTRFVFAYELEDDEEGIIANNWFIYSDSNNYFLRKTQQMLYQYWKDNKICNHYYIFHLFFSMTARNKSDLWENVPIRYDVTTNLLVENLNKPFSKTKYYEIKELSFVHKLNKTVNCSNYKKDSFLEKMLKINGMI